MSKHIYDEENLDIQDENEEVFIKPGGGIVGEDEETENEEQTVQDDVTDNEYRVTVISDAFLRNELEIKSETDRTKVKFVYNGETFSGVVLHKINKQDYIFLVQDAKSRNAQKKMKKIHIPDASLVL